MNMKRILIALFSCAAFCLCAASAQTPVNITVRSAIFPEGGADKLELLLGENGNSMPVKPWGAQLSPPSELPLLPVWRFGFWKEEPGADGKNKKTFVERGRVVPTKARRQWLLFFATKPGAESLLDVKCFAADDSAIQEGGALILNMSPTLIAGKISATEFRTAPNASTYINPKTSVGDQYPVEMAYPDQGKPVFFIRSTWFHSERRRVIALVVQPAGSKAPRLYTIVDVAPDPAASGKRADSTE